ncbi:hypothetical protein M3689_01095 [Alkalihalophilus marmarensis]|jgi:hypothetical protein|uniref:hypothetical protein n=1 Tax=Alkalihalophilus marmarensis TaxID=521377 RepID=UPI0020423D10|nr:hypothetical protein [Alkalihalophilus marmarensis]MCM3487895.1 hypothetical protein [Alkalihalophilus marmarensis]
MMDEINELLLNDSIIKEKVSNRIKFYEYPDASALQGASVVIDPLDVPKPSNYRSNKPTSEEYLYQIEVWSKSKVDRDLIAKRIQDILIDQFDAGQSGGIDEWNQDYDVFRDARRYKITKEILGG